MKRTIDNAINTAQAAAQAAARIQTVEDWKAAPQQVRLCFTRQTLVELMNEDGHDYSDMIANCDKLIAAEAPTVKKQITPQSKNS